MNISLFHNELISVCLNISGCSSDGTVHFIEPDTNNIAPLVLAAHEQPLTSDECLALQAAIINEAWDKYVEARKAPIKNIRALLYKELTDPLMLKALEDSVKNETPPDYSDWVAEKEKIRIANPYPE